MIAQPTTQRIWIARGIAMAADALQIVILPAFAGGGFSPFDGLLDTIVAVVLIVLVGWHWAFLPTFIAELVPGLDLVPTWTAATWLATHGKLRAAKEPNGKP